MIVIISFFLLSAVSLLDASPVVYGTDVKTAKYPFLVYLEISDSASKKYEKDYKTVEICGGTLIGLQTILTAAHCLDTVGEPTIEVTTGILHLAKRARQKQTTTLYKKHDDYEPMVSAQHRKGMKTKQFKNDIALVWVLEPFELSANVKIAQIPIKNPVNEIGFSKATLMFMGWGSAETGRDEDQLKEGPAYAISSKKCQKKHNVVPDENLICVEKPTRATVCHGDSGGPLVYKNVPIGVASFIAAYVKKEVPTTIPKPGARPTRKTTTTSTTEKPAEFRCRSENISTFFSIFPYAAWIRSNMKPPKNRG